MCFFSGNKSAANLIKCNEVTVNFSLWPASCEARVNVALGLDRLRTFALN